MKLNWSSSFKKAYQNIITKNPRFREPIFETISELVNDPFAPKLRTHKLKGELEGSWTCSINFEYRIVFNFVQNTTNGETELLLINIGTHEEVY
jgi:mRNA interferase YafQ